MYRNDILRSAGNKNKDKNKDIFILSYYCRRTFLERIVVIPV